MDDSATYRISLLKPNFCADTALVPKLMPMMDFSPLKIRKPWELKYSFTQRQIQTRKKVNTNFLLVFPRSSGMLFTGWMTMNMHQLSEGHQIDLINMSEKREKGGKRISDRGISCLHRSLAFCFGWGFPVMLVALVIGTLHLIKSIMGFLLPNFKLVRTVGSNCSNCEVKKYVEKLFHHG